VAHGVRVRDAQPDEWAAAGELTRRAYAEYATIMAPRAWAGLERAVRTTLASEPDAEWIVAEIDGALVGSVLLYPPAADLYGGLLGRVRWPELRLLAVAPERRGQGVAEALVNECARRARRAGATELGLHTSSSMQAAMRLYRRMGFVRAPAYDFHPEGAELVEAYLLPLEA
jgi:GNAT superfamily N-acetyltransferase